MEDIINRVDSDRDVAECRLDVYERVGCLCKCYISALTTCGRSSSLADHIMSQSINRNCQITEMLLLPLVISWYLIILSINCKGQIN